MSEPVSTSQTRANPAGLQCPHCGGRRLPVQYTRRKPDHVMRVRRCKACGRRLLTRERPG